MQQSMLCQDAAAVPRVQIVPVLRCGGQAGAALVLHCCSLAAAQGLGQEGTAGVDVTLLLQPVSIWCTLPLMAHLQSFAAAVASELEPANEAAASMQPNGAPSGKAAVAAAISNILEQQQSSQQPGSPPCIRLSVYLPSACIVVAVPGLDPALPKYFAADVQGSSSQLLASMASRICSQQPQVGRAGCCFLLGWTNPVVHKHKCMHSILLTLIGPCLFCGACHPPAGIDIQPAWIGGGANTGAAAGRQGCSWGTAIERLDVCCAHWRCCSACSAGSRRTAGARRLRAGPGADHNAGGKHCRCADGHPPVPNWHWCSWRFTTARAPGGSTAVLPLPFFIRMFPIRLQAGQGFRTAASALMSAGSILLPCPLNWMPCGALRSWSQVGGCAGLFGGSHVLFRCSQACHFVVLCCNDSAICRMLLFRAGCQPELSVLSEQLSASSSVLVSVSSSVGVVLQLEQAALAAAGRLADGLLLLSAAPPPVYGATQATLLLECDVQCALSLPQGTPVCLAARSVRAVACSSIGGVAGSNAAAVAVGSTELTRPGPDGNAQLLAHAAGQQQADGRRRPAAQVFARLR